MSGLISNGTYVLGDPNTRDLYLGKGLKAGFEGDKYYIAADETVLWEGDNNTTFTLSEPLSNFEEYKIVFELYDGLKYEYKSIVNTNFITINFNYLCTNNDANPRQELHIVFTATDDKTFTWNKALFLYGGTNTSWVGSATDSKVAVYKIVGINRKEGN